MTEYLVRCFRQGQAWHSDRFATLDDALAHARQWLDEAGPQARSVTIQNVAFPPV